MFGGWSARTEGKDTSMNATKQTEQTVRYRATDAYIHPNMKGTGSACRLELHPAHDETSGSIFLTLAAQKTLGSGQGAGRVLPTFDWENRLVVKLDRSDLSQILQVLRGMQESVRDGKGLFHRSARACTVIKFTHQIEPHPGYVLAVSRKSEDGKLTQPVNEMNVTGNMVTLWNSLVAVGNDPQLNRSWQIPSLVFEGVNFSGL